VSRFLQERPSICLGAHPAVVVEGRTAIRYRSVARSTAAEKLTRGEEKLIRPVVARGEEKLIRNVPERSEGSRGAIVRPSRTMFLKRFVGGLVRGLLAAGVVLRAQSGVVLRASQSVTREGLLADGSPSLRRTPRARTAPGRHAAACAGAVRTCVAALRIRRTKRVQGKEEDESRDESQDAETAECWRYFMFSDRRSGCSKVLATL